MRGLYLAILILIYILPAHTQCVGRDSLWNRMIFLRESDVDAKDQLHELLGYNKTIETCAYKNDSTHAYLLQRIGVMYYLLADYSTAVEYTSKAISIIHENMYSHSISPQRIINCYSNLATYFDSLSVKGEKNRALDSCISISMRLQSISILTLSAIEKKLRYLNKIGDYQHAVEIAVLGETLSEKYGFKDQDLSDYIFSDHINALVFLKDYDGASKLLQDKIAQMPGKKDRKALGSYYGLLASVKKSEGE